MPHSITASFATREPFQAADASTPQPLFLSTGELTGRQLAFQLRVDPAALLNANPNVRDLDLVIPMGDWVNVPQEPESQLAVHTVGPFDVLPRIAAQHGVSEEALLAYNGIAYAGQVQAGDVLVIPRAVPTTAPDGQARTQALQSAGQIREQALARVGVPVEQWTATEAALYTSFLADAVEAYPGDAALVDALIVLSADELQRSAALLGHATENKDDPEQDVKALTANLSVLGNAASEDVSAVLAQTVASQIPEDSEQNWVDDGFGQFVDRTGADRFLLMLGDALYAQGKQEAGDEMLYTSAGGVLGEGGVFDDVFGAIRDFPGNAWEFARNRVLDPAGDWVREQITDAMCVEDRIAELRSPGDTIVVGADVAGSVLGMELGAAAGVRITMTADGGYELELFGEASLGVAQKLGLAGFDGDLGAEVAVGGTLTFRFDTAEEAVAAAESVVGVAAGVALLGTPAAPIGGVLLASTADELDWVQTSYAGTSVELTAAVTVDGSLPGIAASLGVSEAEVGALVAAGVRVDFARDGSKTLVYSSAMVLEGSLALDSPLELPGDLQLQGTLQGSVSLELETSIPLDADLGELLADPVGTIADATLDPVSPPATSVTLVVDLQQRAGDGGIGSTATGVQLRLTTEGVSSEALVAAATAATAGDLPGALHALGGADSRVTVNSYMQLAVGAGDLDELADGDADDEPDGIEVQVPALGHVEITAGYVQRDYERVWEGGADALATDFTQVLALVDFTPV